MALETANLIIGPARITWRGVDLGFTTREGVTRTTEKEIVEFKAAQTTGTHDAHVTDVGIIVSATFNELTLENLRLLMDIQDAPTGSNPKVLTGIFNRKATQGALVITGPGINGATRIFTATAFVMNPGEIVTNTGEYSGAAVEFKIIEASATRQQFTEAEYPGSLSAPAAASYQTVAANNTETALTDAATGIAINLAIQTTFNVGIRPDQLSSDKFMLKTSAGNSFVAATVGYGLTTGATDYTKVKITPTASLENSTEYQLIIAPGVQSFDGVSGAGSSIQFTTAAP